MFKILFFIFIFFSQINFFNTHLFVIFYPKIYFGDPFWASVEFSVVDTSPTSWDIIKFRLFQTLTYSWGTAFARSAPSVLPLSRSDAAGLFMKSNSPDRCLQMPHMLSLELFFTLHIVFSLHLEEGCCLLSFTFLV